MDVEMLENHIFDCDILRYGVHSALVRVNEELERKVAAPV
jgi:hypothetical protein